VPWKALAPFEHGLPTIKHHILGWHLKRFVVSFMIVVISYMVKLWQLFYSRFFFLSLSKLEKCIVFAKIKKKKSGHLLILLHLILVLLIISNLIYLFFNFITWHLIFFSNLAPCSFGYFFFLTLFLVDLLFQFYPS
jgi:hypothetical protein